MTFKPLLASNENVDEERFGDLVFPYYASPKLDGIRMLCDPVRGPVTRALKPVPNNAIRKFYDNRIFSHLDGEIVASYDGTQVNDENIFNKTQSAVMSQEGAPDFCFYVFDMFHNGDKIPFKLRKEAMEQRVAHIKEYSEGLGQRIVLVEQKLITCIEELIEYEQEQVALGYEGIMLKDPEGIYKHGRSTFKQNILLKVKRFETDEAVITGWKPMMVNMNDPELDEMGYQIRSSHKDGKVADDSRIGVFEATCLTGKFTGAEFECNIPKDSDRREFRKRIDDMIANKEVFRYKHQSHGAKDAPRIPIFLSLCPERQHLATETKPVEDSLF